MPDLGPVYYLDTWPFGPQILIVASPGSLYQITQEHSLPKYHALKAFLRPITDGLDIVTMEGQTWKTWRGIFNPGFSASHLMTLTSGIVEETVRFCDVLQTHLQNQTILHMKDLTDNLAMDVIGRVVLDTQLDSQRQRNPLVDGLRMQIRWLTFGADVNPIERYNPLRPLVHWYNTRRMNQYVSRELNSRMTNFQGKESLQPAKRNKSVIDLALTAYLSEHSGEKAIQAMDSTFKTFAMSQIKLFLFSGHDTTSSSICYIFYILSVNPSALSRACAEHDEIFGLDLDKTASLVIKNPFLLNQLPYTLAVIKETLRMYPAVSSTRAGEPGFNVTDDQGRQFPTDGFLVWANPQLIQRDPAYWLRPDDFIPERWLVPPGDPLHPVKGAWRPFEYGPRNCIGQELAMVEMKIIMVMTLRRFDIKPVYEELDRQKPSGKVRTVHGERGYQIQRAQPSDDLPCRVDKVIR
ncbi:MAG: hypothetical protein M1830_006727 [Pleopsidium flavum]|nr:MAG: hypothetical protein M1830_006727 [Pleopsidium flavum]